MHRLICLAAILCCSCTTIYQKRGVETAVLWGSATSLKNFESAGAEKWRLDAEARSIERYLLDDSRRAQHLGQGTAFTLGTIEINDEGFFNAAQHAQVMSALRCEVALARDSSVLPVGTTLAEFQRQCASIGSGNADTDAAGASGGTLLMVFVHGWHHGCGTCDRDVACFRALLETLAENESRLAVQERRVMRRVFGLYVGWRGRAVFGSADYASIWNRKKIAERLGRTAGKELLSELHTLWKSSESMTMVSLGHSLGGALLMQAARGHLTGNVADILRGEERSYRIARAQGLRAPSPKTAGSTAIAPSGPASKALRSRFGDLVVLLNPAIEAAEWGAFDNDLYDQRFSKSNQAELIAERQPIDKNDEYHEHQLPVLMSISSSSDWAVRYWFFLSRWVRVFNPTRWSTIADRRQYHAIGHYDPYTTHHLQVPDAKIRPEKDPKYDPEKCSCPHRKELLGAPSPAVPELRLMFSAKAESLEEEAPKKELTREQERIVKDSVPKETRVVDLLRLVEARNCEQTVSGTTTPSESSAASSSAVNARKENSSTARQRETCVRGWDPRSPYFVIKVDNRVIGAHSDIFNPVIVGLLTDYLSSYASTLKANPSAGKALRQ